MIEKTIITSLVGAFFSLDMTFLNNFMICRPIFAGPCIGLCIGELSLGIQLGILFEMLWSDIICVGAAIPINVAVAIALVIGCNAAIPHHETGFTMFLIILSLPMIYLSRQIEILLRMYNIQRAHKVDQLVEQGKSWILYSAILHGLWFPFLVNALLLYISITVITLIGKALFFRLSYELIEAFRIGYVMLPILGLAVMFNTFFQKSFRDIYVKCMRYARKGKGKL